VLVTGSSNGDYLTVKYAGGTGAQVWVARYDGFANGDEKALAVTVDSSDNVFIGCGHSVRASLRGRIMNMKGPAVAILLLFVLGMNT